MFYFLKEDFVRLNEEIEIICGRIRDIGREMGRSCDEGHETFHDNFAFEDGERQQYMWSNKLRGLINIRNNAQVTLPGTNLTRVSIGRSVTVEDAETGDRQTFRVGSYMIFSQAQECQIKEYSYDSPICRLIIGSEVGDVKEWIINKKKRTICIVEIQ